jgi:glycosyltransferase involved in cell wall biosynthesis
MNSPNQPLVSIALCTYNGQQYLRQQLDTLVGQTYPNIEIVVVDDASTDDTFAILNEYANCYAQFNIYQNKANLGFVKNFERTCTLCNGDYIALCDQDDIWLLNKIELQVNAIAQHVFIYHDSEFVDQNGLSLNKKMSDVMNMYSGGDPKAFLFLNCVSGHTMLMKRELIGEAFPLKPGFFHDWWLAYVAVNMGTIAYLPQCLVQYRQHEQSDTNILKIDRAKDNYNFSSFTHYERMLQWLGYCQAYPKNKHPEVVTAFYEAFTERQHSFVTFKLSYLMLKYMDIVLYIRKKSTLSKINYIYKQIWGLKAKRNHE